VAARLERLKQLDQFKGRACRRMRYAQHIGTAAIAARYLRIVKRITHSEINVYPENGGAAVFGPPARASGGYAYEHFVHVRA
jgi:hypothetical protein